MSPKNPYNSAAEKMEDVEDSLEEEEDEESKMLDKTGDGTDFVAKLKKRRKKK